MNAEQARGREVMSAIREILINEWDPIRVMDDPEWPRDEYDGYVGQIFSFLEREESAEFIAHHLCFVEEKVMGLGAVQPAARMGVAMKLKAVAIGPTGHSSQ
jgi:hypothetical protein